MLQSELETRSRHVLGTFCIHQMGGASACNKSCWATSSQPISVGLTWDCAWRRVAVYKCPRAEVIVDVRTNLWRCAGPNNRRITSSSSPRNWWTYPRGSGSQRGEELLLGVIKEIPSTKHEVRKLVGVWMSVYDTATGDWHCLRFRPLCLKSRTLRLGERKTIGIKLSAERVVRVVESGSVPWRRENALDERQGATSNRGGSASRSTK